MSETKLIWALLETRRERMLVFMIKLEYIAMWKAVRHVLTAFHCLWSTISCILTHFMVFFMSHEYDTNPESVFPLSISIQPLLLLTKERQEHEKYLEYTHTHNRRLLPLKIYSSRPIWKNNLMQQIFLPGLTLPWIWCEINIYLPFQKPSLSLSEPSHSSSNSSKILNYLNQKHIQFAKTVWGLTFYFANQMFKEVHTFLSGLHQ